MWAMDALPAMKAPSTVGTGLPLPWISSLPALPSMVSLPP